jgi:Arc/MetJ family transcription regulator
MASKRTNIEIDEDLVAEAMERYGTRSMRETVDLALRHLVGETMSVEDALALRGTGWDGDLEAMRAGWDRTRAGALDGPDEAASGAAPGCER